MTKMSLAAAAELVPESRKGPSCTIATLIDQLDDEDRTQLNAWIELPSSAMSHSRLARILRAAGHNVGTDPLARHRKGECACLRS